MPQVNEFSWFSMIFFCLVSMMFWMVFINFSSSFYFSLFPKVFHKLVFYSF